MVIKSVGVMLITISCALCGCSVKYKHNVRIKELQNLLLCFDIIGIEIAANLCNIYYAIKKAMEQASEINYILFSNVYINHKKLNEASFSSLWCEALDNIKSEYMIFEDRDIEIFQKFGNMFGAGNTDEQEKNICVLKKSINTLLDEAIEKGKKINLSVKIGVYTGIVISILLI